MCDFVFTNNELRSRTTTGRGGSLLRSPDWISRVRGRARTHRVGRRKESVQESDLIYVDETGLELDALGRKHAIEEQLEAVKTAENPDEAFDSWIDH
jgi:hypothetical protein